MELPENDNNRNSSRNRDLFTPKGGLPQWVKPLSYSSRLVVYALVCPFFVRRKIGWLSEPKEYTVGTPAGLWVRAMAQKNVPAAARPVLPGSGAKR
jgi:hypothetical protein